MSTVEAYSPGPKWGAGTITSRVFALVLLLLVAAGIVWMMPFRAEVPTGCDEFGYLRQAELFRAKGVDGFDTRLTAASAERLVKVMLDSGEPAAEWYQAVAPHCHHYRAATGTVILQYPPGTGALMALFPAAEQQRLLRIASVLATAAIFVLLIGMAPSGLGAALGLAAAAGTMWAAATGSDSVPPATAAAVLCGWLLVPALERRNLVALLAFGIAAGLGGSLRVTNLMIPLATGLVMLALLALERRRGNLVALVVFGAGLAMGLMPFAWANYVNTGSPFSSTYSPIDASSPKLDLDGLLRGLEFYFRPEPQGLVLMGAVAAVLLMLPERPRSPALVTASLALAGSLLYLVPKDVLIGYYLIPVSGFVLATILALQGNGAPSRIWRGLTGSVLGAVVVGLGVTFCLMRPFPDTDLPPVAPAVEAALAQDPIVWADLTGGRFVTWYGVYSAKLAFTSAELQDKMVAGLAQIAQPQMIVLDSDVMKQVFQRLSADWTMQPLGDAFGAEVYGIGPQIRR